jgi:hypothetical protein
MLMANAKNTTYLFLLQITPLKVPPMNLLQFCKMIIHPQDSSPSLVEVNKVVKIALSLSKLLKNLLMTTLMNGLKLLSTGAIK